MKLVAEFPALTAQRQRMRAELSDWNIGTATLNPRAKLQAELNKGIKRKTFDDVKVVAGGLLSHKDEQILLYIKDTKQSRRTLENALEKSKRFHVAECKTLREMRECGRFERYIMTNRRDGKFAVDYHDKETGKRGEIEAAVKVCMNCLEEINYQGYLESKQLRDKIWKEFSISDFLGSYATFFQSLPSQSDKTSRPNIYAENWHNISRKRREEVNWQCEQCGVNLSKHKNLLHCHHKSGNVTDNSSANLLVLCILCHAKQPQHAHMSVVPSQKRIITMERSEQGRSAQ